MEGDIPAESVAAALGFGVRKLFFFGISVSPSAGHARLAGGSGMEEWDG